MGIFSTPDFRQMRRDHDWPRLIHWALYDKDRENSRAARAVLRKNVPGLVEYLYDTACWSQKNAVGRRKTLPSRGVKLLNEAVKVLIRLGPAAVDPLVHAIRAYDEYGDPDEHTRFLFLVLVIDALEKIGRPAVAGLQLLADDRHTDVAEHAREALQQLDARGLVQDEDDDEDEPVEDGED